MTTARFSAPTNQPAPKSTQAWPIAPDVAADLERSDWTPEEALRWYAAGKHYDTVPNGDGSSSARLLDNGAVASNALKSLSREYAERKGDVALQKPAPQPSPAGKYPLLPEPAYFAGPRPYVLVEHAYAGDQMRAYVDADRATRTVQTVGAQQPGTAHAALPGAHAAWSALTETPSYVLRVKSKRGKWSPWVPLGGGLVHGEVEVRLQKDAAPIAQPAHATQGDAPSQITRDVLAEPDLPDSAAA